MNKAYYTLVVLPLVIWMFSCSNNNRMEFCMQSINDEHHIDSMAVKCVDILTSQMAYHHTARLGQSSQYYHNFFTNVDSIYWAWFYDKSLMEIQRFRSAEHEPLRYQLNEEFQNIRSDYTSDFVADSLIITNVFLSSHVKNAIKTLQESRFAKHLTFEQFCEYILPYRVADEDVLAPATAILKRMQNYIDCDSLSLTDIIDYYNVYISKMRWLTSRIQVNDHIGAYDILLPKFSYDCHNIAITTTNVFRKLGIPTVYEFTPMWQDRPRAHFWCASMDSMGIFRPFTPPDNNLMGDWESNLQYAGKVYRKTFFAQKDSPYFLRNKNEDLPELFNSPLISDQTYRYHQTVTLDIPMIVNTSNKMVYLCFYDRNDVGITPVGWGVLDHERGRAIFKQVPLNILFFPAYYEGGNLIPLGAPIMLEADQPIDWLPQPHTLPATIEYEEPLLQVTKDGKLRCGWKIAKGIKLIQYRKRDSTTLHIERKYPMKHHQMEMAESFVGITIGGSQLPDGPRDTLFTFKDTPSLVLQERNLRNKQAYKYYHVFSPHNKVFYIAHLEFLGDTTSLCKWTAPTPLATLIQPLDSIQQPLVKYLGVPMGERPEPTNAYDSDILTYIGTRYLGMQFHEPVIVKAVRFSPRNADNGISIGDVYTLYYYDSGWQYHSTQQARRNFLSFECVPGNTIYWLENETRGNEELPFTYENGMQMFINNYRTIN